MAIKSDAQHKQDSAAPPSYAAAVAQSGPSSSRSQPPPPPQAVTRTLSLPGDEQSHLTHSRRAYYGSNSTMRDAEAQWFPPTSEREVKSRARKRFFIAFLWAFAIYTLLGYVVATATPPTSGFPSLRIADHLLVGCDVTDCLSAAR